MAKSSYTTLKQSERAVRLTLDLKKMFGVDFTGLSDLKEVIALAAIDKIVSRTLDGKDVNGRAFKPYSESYKKSKVFRMMGKKPGEVNLRLFGTMLGTIEVIDQAGSKITLGWMDSTENAKAFNHNTGDTLPKREFFGLNDSEVESLIEEFKDLVEEETSPTKVSRKILSDIKKSDIERFIERIELPELEFPKLEYTGDI